MRNSSHAPGLGLPTALSADRKTEFLRIVCRAIAPTERTAGEAVEHDESFEDEAQRLVQRWEQLVRFKAVGDPRAFARRLADFGLNPDSAVRWLLPEIRDVADPWPTWASVAHEVLGFQTESVDEGRVEDSCDVEQDVVQCDSTGVPVFPRFLSPFLATFRRRLRLSVADLDELAHPRAVDQIVRSLLVKLSTIAARTIAYEVKQRRARDELAGDSPSARYRDFETSIASLAGRTALFQAYPVLLRLLATVTLNLLDATAELLGRFRADRSLIADLLANSGGVGPIDSAIEGLSDPHLQGRTVWLLEFSGEARVIYKPRNVAIDAAYARVLEWLNGCGELLEMRCARVVARDGYGWCEYIQARDCVEEREVARYFRRQGIHVALFHFLCGADFHEGNFIAAGEWPIPIDLEGLLTPTQHIPSEAFRDLPPQLLPTSMTVAMTTLLPRWKAGSPGTLAYSASGINGPGDRVWPIRRPFWRELGSDQMQLSYEYAADGHPSASRPRLAGREVGVEQYLDEVVEGFREAYAVILRAREGLLQPGGILDDFRRTPNRAVLRDSREYADLLFWATAPDLLTSGAAQHVALEMLGPIPGDRAIEKYEHRCLWQRDFPIFRGLPCRSDLSTDEESFRAAVESPSFDQMIERLRAASEEQQEWQSGMIRASFRMALASVPQPPLGYCPKDSQGDAQGGSPPESLSQSDRNRLIEQAFELGETLDALAIRHRRGCSWLSLQRTSPTAPPLELVVPQPWMTAGAAGTALFLARLARATGDNRFAELSGLALRFANEAFEECRRRIADPHLMPMGLNGTGLMVYSLSTCAALLDDSQWSDRSLQLALAIPLDFCREVRNPDLLNGAAGLLLAILSLYRRHPDRLLLDRAQGLAAGILACQERGEGPAGFHVPEMHRPVLGMAHGAAGIAMALSRLHHIDGNRRWSDAARRGIDYERLHFCSEERDWPALQLHLDTPQFMTGWCGGAPGIGLSRLAIKETCDLAIEDEINTAVDTTVRRLGSGPHNLCCGEAGRITFLAEAGRSLGRPELTATAANSALRMIDEYAGCGFWKLQHYCERSIVPGLLDGISGLGLALLDVACPEPDFHVLTVD
jgi:type 2 lantibiotic biosynthesis protein LanM